MLTKPWILLRLRIRDYGIWAEYEDDEGLRYSSRGSSPQEWRVHLDLFRYSDRYVLRPPELALFAPPALRRLVAEKAGYLRSLPANPATGRPAPVPVFLHVPAALSVFSWEPMFAEILGEGVQVIRLARSRRWQPRSPFRLPFRVHAVGRAAELSLIRVQHHSWLELEDVRNFGLEIGSSKTGRLDGFAAGKGPDVLLCDVQDAPELLPRIGRLKDLESRPRLIVVTSFRNPQLDRVLAQLSRPVRGASVIWASTQLGADAEFVNELLYRVLHDQPLHEAVQEVSKLRLTLWPPLLVSDPAGVEDLRMADALGELIHETAELEARLLPGDVRSFFQRALPDCPPRLEKAMWTLDSLAQPLQHAIERINSLEIDFGRETTSMVPIAESRGSLARALEQEEQILRMLQSISSDAESRAAIAKHQERRVDVVLGRLDRSPFPRPWVKQDETLRRGARYRVRVHIGRPLQLSLVTGEVPPLDPLLPESPQEGVHLLHVALYGLDFKACSDTLLPLRLPLLGGSKPVSFDIQAPRRTGKASLRIAVYYDRPPDASSGYYNNLLQSFLLEAQVEEEELEGVTDGTVVRLEFSQTERFANLSCLTPRVLSLGLNDGPGGATHTLTAKRGAQKEEIRLEEKVLDKQLTRLRDLLCAATRNDAGKARFPETAAGPDREADFDQAVRDLARAGKELYDRVWQDASEDFQDALDEVKRSEDKVVQVVRFAQNYLFPWSAFYDYLHPPTLAGEPPREVCRGFQRRGPDGTTPLTCSQCLAQCLHPDKREAFCVYGFWGTRHQVEQLLHTPGKGENVIVDLMPIRDGAVEVGLGLQGGLAATLPSTLAQRVGARWVRELKAEEDLLDELWTDERRPAVLVLLSHFETQDVPGQATGPRLTLPGGKWLQPSDLLNRLQELPKERRKWKEPNPVILLAACESTDIDLGTLASFLGAFADSRAAAVVGTEVVVFEGIAARFGREVAADLLEGKRLGEAMVRFRRSLLQQLNPLGLVFTPYGSADLVRPKERSDESATGL